MSWANSDRRSRLPANWSSEIRPAVLKRDPICRCPGCPRCTPEGCPRSSTDADHIIPIDDHSMTNLRGLCNPCHLVKSAGEGLAARRRISAARTRPQPQHPGSTPGG